MAVEEEGDVFPLCKSHAFGCRLSLLFIVLWEYAVLAHLRCSFLGSCKCQHQVRTLGGIPVQMSSFLITMMTLILQHPVSTEQ